MKCLIVTFVKISAKNIFDKSVSIIYKVFALTFFRARLRANKYHTIENRIANGKMKKINPRTKLYPSLQVSHRPSARQVEQAWLLRPEMYKTIAITRGLKGKIFLNMTFSKYLNLRRSNYKFDEPRCPHEASVTNHPTVAQYSRESPINQRCRLEIGRHFDIYTSHTKERCPCHH